MKKIKYGKKDLITEEDLDPQNSKERISIWVDETIVTAFRKRAHEQNTKYQTLMNEALREFIAKPSLVKRVERIEHELKLKSAI